MRQAVETRYSTFSLQFSARLCQAKNVLYFQKNTSGWIHTRSTDPRLFADFPKILPGDCRMLQTSVIFQAAVRTPSNMRQGVETRYSTWKKNDTYVWIRCVYFFLSYPPTRIVSGRLSDGVLYIVSTQSNCFRRYSTAVGTQKRGPPKNRKNIVPTAVMFWKWSKI